MEVILEIIILFIHWRLILSIGSAIIISLFLARYISWFGAGEGLCATLLAVGFGIIWCSLAEAKIPLFSKVKNTKIFKPVAVGSLLFIGAVWYGVFSALFSPLIGCLIISVFFVIGATGYYFAKKLLPIH